MDDYTRVVYTRTMGLKSQEGRVEHLVGTQDTRGYDGQRARVIDGEMREICEKEGTTLSTTIPYHRASNGVAECDRRTHHTARAAEVPMGGGVQHGDRKAQ